MMDRAIASSWQDRAGATIALFIPPLLQMGRAARSRRLYTGSQLLADGALHAPSDYL
jgi:hypothetical protein